MRLILFAQGLSLRSNPGLKLGNAFGVDCRLLIICILTELLNLTRQNGMTHRHIAGIREFLSGTRVEKRDSAAQRPTGFAGSPHGVRSRKVLLDMR